MDVAQRREDAGLLVAKVAIQRRIPVVAQEFAHRHHRDHLGIGQPRRDWRATVLSDGVIVVRHPDLRTTLELIERVADEVRLYAA